MSRIPDDSRIIGVDIARCALPITRPVHIGRTVYTEREYALVRIRLADGGHGEGFGYTRGLPIDAMLEVLAPSLMGTDGTRPAVVVEQLATSHRNAAAGFLRAIGLLDIATWDALSRHSQIPLWRLLGGARDRVPVMAVGGYAPAAGGPDAIADELRTLVDAGYRHLKLHTADPLVARAAAHAVDGQALLAVDAGMSWGTLPDALEGCRPLDDLGLLFIEDVFPPELWRLTGELATRLRTPLAAGEDATGREALVDLIDGVAVLRIDATASGGYAAVLGAAAVAAARGRRVMTHAFPDLHAHLAGAAPVEMIELIPESTGLNPIGALLARRQRLDRGDLVLSDEPGHGAPLDWAAVLRNASRVITVDA